MLSVQLAMCCELAECECAMLLETLPASSISNSSYPLSSHHHAHPRMQPPKRKRVSRPSIDLIGEEKSRKGVSGEVRQSSRFDLFLSPVYLDTAKKNCERSERWELQGEPRWGVEEVSTGQGSDVLLLLRLLVLRPLPSCSMSHCKLKSGC